MNVNLQPQTPAISEWLRRAAAQLAGIGIASARLDAEIILAHTLRQPRVFLHAHSDDALEPRHREIADARLQLRLDRTPIAYIIGHKEFYGRRFKVTTATLIPRPESEDMVTIVTEIAPKNIALIPQSLRIVDVGTGSGCLGITAKLEIPEATVTLIDMSNHALTVAKHNAKALGADVLIQRGDLLRGYPFAIDIIMANLPYVDREWEVSPETQAEPAMALFAGSNGLALINQLILQASQKLVPKGTLLLEADPRQHDAIIAIAKTHGLAHRQTRGFIVDLVAN
jgi:release factor glutamine methyltransferase